MSLAITFDEQAVRGLAQKYRAKTLSVFGSVLTDRFREDSDIDMMVEFLPEASPTFIELMQLQAELSDLLGRKVDLRTPNELSQHFRDEVIKHAVVQYAA